MDGKTARDGVFIQTGQEALMLAGKEASSLESAESGQSRD